MRIEVKAEIIPKFVVFLLAVFIASMSFAASFECARASTKVEKLICSDPERSKSDEDLTVSYVRVLKSALDPEAIKNQQRKWLSEVRNHCDEVACLREAYASRIKQLASIGKRKTLAVVAQSTTDFWVTNGSVNAVAHAADGSIVYLGGDFSQVGPRSGSFVAIDGESGTATASFPFFDGEVNAIASDGAGAFISAVASGTWGIARAQTSHIFLPTEMLTLISTRTLATRSRPLSYQAARFTLVDFSTQLVDGSGITLPRLMPRPVPPLPGIRI